MNSTLCGTNAPGSPVPAAPTAQGHRRETLLLALILAVHVSLSARMLAILPLWGR